MPDPTDIHVRASADTAAQIRRSPRTKPAPNASALPIPFTYAPSPDGVDENLLVLLHGLGDTHGPFASLGRALNLPQTATLALCASLQLPFLDAPGFQWYPSLTALAEPDPQADPTPAFDLISTVISYLTTECQWPTNRVHMFGFAQGGSVAVETVVRWGRETEKGKGKDKGKEGETSSGVGALGSIVSVCGSLLSYPTPGMPACPTPLFYFHRPSATRPSAASTLAALRKAFHSVTEASFPVKLTDDEGGEEGEVSMPRTRDEWEPVMRFWGQRLSRRAPADDGDVYEVMTGT